VSLPIRLTIIACAIFLGGCAADDAPDAARADREATPTVARTVLQVRPSVGIGRSTRVRPTPSPLPIRPTVRVADQLEEYLERVLGGPSGRGNLSSHIRSVSVGLQVATVRTDLALDDPGKAVAEQICLVVSLFKYNPEGSDVTRLDVEVYGETGELIAAYDDTAPLASTTSPSWRLTPRN
jgi:hypothetical protein